MKKHLPTLIIITLIFIVTSCKKSNQSDPTPSYDYLNSYLPLKPGNTWTYIHNGKDTIITKVGNNSFMQGFQTFYGVESTIADDMYFSQGDKAYYMMIYPGIGPGFSSPILDASESEGYSITTMDSTTTSSGSAPALSTLTILETNFNKTINGKTYKNVVHTVLDVYEAFNGNYMNIQSYDFYFSPAIGLIEIDKSNAGYVYDSLTIVSYKVT